MSETPQHNFSRVSARDAIAFGSSRPGFPSKEVPLVDVQAWSTFIKSHGIKRVLSLLGDDEKEFYKDLDIDEEMAREFGADKYARTSVFVPEAMKTISAALAGAREAAEPIVIHCSGGEGRASLGQGVWLVEQYALAPEDAAREIMEEAERTGVNRRMNAGKLAWLVEKGTMVGFGK